MDSRPAGETLARFPKYSLHTLRQADADQAPPVDGGTTSFVVVDEVACSLSLMSAILSWKLSISENIVLYNCALKHPKTIHLSTPLCKGHNCSTVQHNFIYDGHVNPSFSQSATQPAIQSASRSAVQPYPEQHGPMPDAAKAKS